MTKTAEKTKLANTGLQKHVKTSCFWNPFSKIQTLFCNEADKAEAEFKKLKQKHKNPSLQLNALFSVTNLHKKNPYDVR